MTQPIASLGMYDLPAQVDANDRLWAAIARVLAARGIADVPRTLTRTADLDTLWRDPALLFGQTCGYPLVTRALPLRPIALPVYAIPDGEGGRHHSVLVTRRSDPDRPVAAFRGAVAAVNDPASNTGMNLFHAAIAPLAGGARFFGSVIHTGSHRASIRAILRGEADLAAIDAVSHAALQRHEPDLTTALRIVGRTPSSPTLPFVTAQDTPPDTVAALRLALAEAFADPALASAREALLLTGIAPVGPEDFAGLETLAAAAAAAGYPELA